LSPFFISSFLFIGWAPVCDAEGQSRSKEPKTVATRMEISFLMFFLSVK